MTTKLRLIVSAVLLSSALQAAEKDATPAEPQAEPKPAVPVAPAKPDAPAAEVGRVIPNAPAAEVGRVIPNAPAQAAPGTAASTSDEVVTLPAVQVTRSRIRQIDVTIKRIDKLIARERKHLKTSDTDLALNHDKIANKAALFGGYSTSQRIAVASERVRLLESERELLEQMKAPMTKDDFAVVEKQVELLRTARRELDEVYR